GSPPLQRKMTFEHDARRQADTGTKNTLGYLGERRSRSQGDALVFTSRAAGSGHEQGGSAQREGGVDGIHNLGEAMRHIVSDVGSQWAEQEPGQVVMPRGIQAVLEQLVEKDSQPRVLSRAPTHLHQV